MGLCSHKGCEEIAAWHPALFLKSEAYHDPARMIIDLKFCDNCRRTLKIEDLLTDENWEHLIATVINLGGLPPTRELTVLNWISVDSYESELMAKMKNEI